MTASRPSLGELWAALLDLAAEAKSRAAEFEALRRLAPDFVARLKQAGLMKVLVPAEVGGQIGQGGPQFAQRGSGFSHASLLFVALRGAC